MNNAGAMRRCKTAPAISIAHRSAWAEPQPFLGYKLIETLAGCILHHQNIPAVLGDDVIEVYDVRVGSGAMRP